MLKKIESMRKLQTSLSFVIILIAFTVLSGCTSDQTYVPPSKVEQTTNNVENTPNSPVINSPQPEVQKIKIFSIGDTASDNELKVTVNDVKFTSEINEKDNEFLVAKAPSGKQYAIVDLTVENMLSDKTQSVSTMFATSLVDDDGYTYDIDFEGLTSLDKAFKDGEILPNMKKRGQIAYLVPSGKTSLQFIYKFDVFVGTSAVFNIK